MTKPILARCFALDMGATPQASAQPVGQCAAACDQAHSRVIVLGHAGTSIDVWELSLGEPARWRRLEVSGPVPGWRLSAAAVYDPAEDRLWMFGGGSPDGLFTGELWSLALSGSRTWTRVEVGKPRPQGRGDHVLALDASRRRLLMFGGRVNPQSTRGDCWALNLTGPPAWERLAEFESGPSSRWGAAAVIDSRRDRLVVMGGQHGGLNKSATKMFLGLGSRFDADLAKDVWALQLSAGGGWSPLPFAGDSLPPGRAFAAVHDSLGDRIVVFGGENRQGVPAEGVWTLRLDSLRCRRVPETSPAPAPRAAALVLADPTRADRFFAVGGWSGAAQHIDAWRLDVGAEAKWAPVDLEGAGPGGRNLAAFVPDPARDRVLLFGGRIRGAPTNDVWELVPGDSDAWRELRLARTPPNSRAAHAAAIDTKRDRRIVIGGEGADSLDDDVWEPSLGEPPAWKRLGPRGWGRGSDGPRPRSTIRSAIASFSGVAGRP